MTAPVNNDKGLTISDQRSRACPSLSVVIVNWNSKDCLRQCLRSIELNGEGLATQVIVVDGGSFDGCDEMLSNEFPWVEFIQSKENIGFGRCNNLGADKATGKYLLLLNPDTELKSGALPALIQALQTLPKAGAIGARLLNTDGSLQTSSVQALPTPINQALDSNLLRQLFPKSKLWSTYEAYHSDAPTAVEAVSGACIAVSRSLFKQIGGFSHEYFMYAEDMDLCKKIETADYIVYHQPLAIVTHHGGGSSSTTFSKFGVVMNLEALAVYMHKSRGNASKTIFKLLMAGSASIRLLPLCLAWPFSPANRRSQISASIRRWKFTLSWALCRENWANDYFNFNNPNSKDMALSPQ